MDIDMDQQKYQHHQKQQQKQLNDLYDNGYSGVVLDQIFIPKMNIIDISIEHYNYMYSFICSSSSSSNILVEAEDIGIDEDINRVID